MAMPLKKTAEQEIAFHRGFVFARQNRAFDQNKSTLLFEEIETLHSVYNEDDIRVEVDNEGYRLLIWVGGSKQIRSSLIVLSQDTDIDYVDEVLAGLKKGLVELAARLPLASS